MDKTLRKEYIEKAFKLHNAGKIQEAKNFYKKIIGENPKDFEVLNLIGICDFQNKDYVSAQNYVTQAISIKPTHYFYEILSQIYDAQNDYDKELSTLLEAQKVIGLNYQLAFRLAFLYKQLKDYDNAERYYILAIQLNPKSKEAYFNLAIVYSLQRKYRNEKECFLKALAMNPNDDEIKYFLGICNFRLKNYEEGLPYFEHRLCRKTAIETQKHTYPNLFAQDKLWRGEDISDKTLYTYFEAGLGDMIMFARYLPLIKCKKIILKPQIELTQLFRENFPEIDVMDCFYAEKDLNFDVHIPFLSIPYALGLTTKSMFPSRKRYLTANKEKVAQYKQEYFDNDKFKIGIKWQGNTYYENDRVINVEAFSGLFDLENTQIYSLQKGAGSEEFEKLAQKHNIIDLSASFKDFSYTAAAVENLDLVICNDTSVAHIAGAMNKPCIVLLPYNYNWRWHEDLDYCDWYESVKVFVCDKDEPWNSVMTRVIESIKR